MTAPVPRFADRPVIPSRDGDGESEFSAFAGVDRVNEAMPSSPHAHNPTAERLTQYFGGWHQPWLLPNPTN